MRKDRNGREEENEEKISKLGRLLISSHSFHRLLFHTQYFDSHTYTYKSSGVFFFLYFSCVSGGTSHRNLTTEKLIKSNGISLECGSSSVSFGEFGQFHNIVRSGHIFASHRIESSWKWDRKTNNKWFRHWYQNGGIFFYSQSISYDSFKRTFPSFKRTKQIRLVNWSWFLSLSTNLLFYSHFWASIILVLTVYFFQKKNFFFFYSSDFGLWKYIQTKITTHALLLISRVSVMLQRYLAKNCMKFFVKSIQIWTVKSNSTNTYRLVQQNNMQTHTNTIHTKTTFMPFRHIWLTENDTYDNKCSAYEIHSQ